MEVTKMVDGIWIRCPFCGNKTRDRLREDTVLINYPLYCPKCKQERDFVQYEQDDARSV